MQIWEKMSNENDRAWGAFQVYRDMPLRSLSEVAARVKLALSTIEGYAKTYQWDWRVSMFDEYCWGRIQSQFGGASKRLAGTIFGAALKRAVLVEEQLEDALKVRHEIMTDSTQPAAARLRAAESVLKEMEYEQPIVKQVLQATAPTPTAEDALKDVIAKMNAKQITLLRALLKEVEGD